MLFFYPKQLAVTCRNNNVITIRQNTGRVTNGRDVRQETVTLTANSSADTIEELMHSSQCRSRVKFIRGMGAYQERLRGEFLKESGASSQGKF